GLAVQDAGDRGLADPGFAGNVDEPCHQAAPFMTRGVIAVAGSSSASSCVFLHIWAVRFYSDGTRHTPAPVAYDHDSKEKTCRSVERASSPSAASPPPPPCSPRAAAPTPATRAPPAPARPTPAAATLRQAAALAWSSGPTRRRLPRSSPPRRPGARRTAWRSSSR